MELVLLMISVWAAPAFVSAADGDNDSAFNYDYESLRIGGLFFAVVLFVLGIALIVSRKCTCTGDQSRPRGADAESGVPRA
ncbi:FXYD domain-containing ion transport regulator 6-like isoform X2 [Eucyclogobius newberryi]|uniref:FXYD domain-containing ion transport regulator 6-like isoform X2 n=1 Tax=Eucyclogobius newberryi TaxID=166745 RepID=UPI003B5B704E